MSPGMVSVLNGVPVYPAGTMFTPPSGAIAPASPPSLELPLVEPLAVPRVEPLVPPPDPPLLLVVEPLLVLEPLVVEEPPLLLPLPPLPLDAEPEEGPPGSEPPLVVPQAGAIRTSAGAIKTSAVDRAAFPVFARRLASATDIARRDLQAVCRAQSMINSR